MIPRPTYRIGGHIQIGSTKRTKINVEGRAYMNIAAYTTTALGMKIELLSIILSIVVNLSA